MPQADVTIKVGDNWKDPVTSRTPACSGTHVVSVLAGRSPDTGVSLMLYTGTKGSSCVTIRVWYCEFKGSYAYYKLNIVVIRQIVLITASVSNMLHRKTT